MKEAKSTKNKDKKNFKNVLSPGNKGSPKRSNTKDERAHFNQKDQHEDKLHISSDENEEENESGAKVMGNTLGFFPMNKLSQSNKMFQKNDIRSKRFGEGGEEFINNIGRATERKDKTKKSLFKNDDERKLKDSKSSGEHTLNEVRIKDTMNLNEYNDPVSNPSQDWQNENIGRYQSVDQSKRGRNKTSRVESREGSKKSKRHKNVMSSVQSIRTKANKSRQGAKRILHQPRKDVIFSELISKNEVEEMKLGKFEYDNDPAKQDESEECEYNEIKVDKEHLNDAISINYTLGDRSASFSVDDQSFIADKKHKDENNFIEIVEQDSFEKLEAYRDRCPCLRIRKFIMRIRLMITKSAEAIICHWLFEYTSLMVIVANSIVLTMEDPTDPNASASGPMATLDSVFLILYSIEMGLKILGLGFVLNQGAYLRDSWNILDFIIVTSAYLQLMMSSGANLSVLRSFRVLRPLRTISGIEGLRVIVSALMKSVTLLVDTLIILLFFFIIFAIGGLQLLSGVLKRR